jgi:hypothetical protein
VFPRVTPHDVQHTAASLAVSPGCERQGGTEDARAASAAMTLDTYADLFCFPPRRKWSRIGFVFLMLAT